MKNTIENKAKFFAQYWGQNIYNEYGHWNGEPVNANSMAILSVQMPFLLLKPLSSITDEDAIDVAKIGISNCEIKGFEVIKIERKDIVKVHINFFGLSGINGYFINISHNGNLSSFQTYNEDLIQTFYQFPLLAHDHLRSKGYALPFHDLSVEDLIKYGWVKLK